jgi:hypothetical protein
MKDDMDDDLIRIHLESHWKVPAARHAWAAAPRKLKGRGILVLPPGPVHSFWIYSTDGMSAGRSSEPLELFLFSSDSSDLHIELLSAVAAYHQQERLLGIGHTVNFGRPWLPGSQCQYCLISTPYLDGPEVEQFRIAAETAARFGWLIPITLAERDFKIQHGLEALERRFEKGLDYLNPRRLSVVKGNAAPPEA